MRVEVDYGDGTVGTVDGTKEWEGDGVVAAEGDDSWQGLTVLCGAFLLGVCGGGAGEDAVVAFFDLVEGPCIVIPISSTINIMPGRYLREGKEGEAIRSHRDISTIQDSSPAIERIRIQRHVVSSTEANPA